MACCDDVRRSTSGIAEMAGERLLSGWHQAKNRTRMVSHTPPDLRWRTQNKRNRTHCSKLATRSGNWNPFRIFDRPRNSPYVSTSAEHAAQTAARVTGVTAETSAPA